jgi:hypothetical protein
MCICVLNICLKLYIKPAKSLSVGENQFLNFKTKFQMLFFNDRWQGFPNIIVSMRDLAFGFNTFEGDGI